MQIGFFMALEDEAALAIRVRELGACFLPAAYPEWPLPQISSPLPPATDPYMDPLSIWHPEIFTPNELSLPENRAFNPRGAFYLSSVWPVIEFSRPRTDRLPLHEGRLSLDAIETSFRLSRPFPQLTAAELRDFQSRLGKLQRLYKTLGVWVSQHMLRLDRGLYCSASLESTIHGPQ